MSSGEGGSSSSGESGNSSSGEGGGGSGGDTTYAGGTEDWEYNYHAKLDTIIKWLKRIYVETGNVSTEIGGKLDDQTAALLEKITTWSPSKLDEILDAIKDIGGDTTIVNVDAADSNLYERLDSLLKVQDRQLWYDSIQAEMGMANVRGWDSLYRRQEERDSVLDYQWRVDTNARDRIWDYSYATALYLDSIAGLLEDGFGNGSGGDSGTGDYWDGDSAIGALTDTIVSAFDTNGWQGYFDTTNYAGCFGDSTECGLAGFEGDLDSVLGGFTQAGNDSLAEGIGAQIKGLADSGAVKEFTDSLSAMYDKFDFKRFSGNGGCPSFLTEKHTFNFGHGMMFEMDGVGSVLCTYTIPVVGTTMWVLGRNLLRAIIAVLCMLWLFKVATGATSGGDDD